MSAGAWGLRVEDKNALLHAFFDTKKVLVIPEKLHPALCGKSTFNHFGGHQAVCRVLF